MPTPPPTFLDRYKGYEFFLPNGGGKAGTRKNLTSNVQVRHKQCIEKQFKFNIGDEASYFAALQKARDWVDANPLPTDKPKSEVIPLTPSQAQEEPSTRVEVFAAALQKMKAKLRKGCRQTIDQIPDATEWPINDHPCIEVKHGNQWLPLKLWDETVFFKTFEERDRTLLFLVSLYAVRAIRPHKGGD